MYVVGTECCYRVCVVCVSHSDPSMWWGVVDGRRCVRLLGGTRQRPPTTDGCSCCGLRPPPAAMVLMGRRSKCGFDRAGRHILEVHIYIPGTNDIYQVCMICMFMCVKNI